MHQLSCHCEAVFAGLQGAQRSDAIFLSDLTHNYVHILIGNVTLVKIASLAKSRTKIVQPRPHRERAAEIHGR